MNTLDIRQFNPIERGMRLSNLINVLSTGEGFILIDDQDPISRYPELSEARPRSLHTEYLESGPTVWRLAIRRIQNREANAADCCGICGS